MPYNTGNPVGSTDPRDLFDNAGILDKFANGEDPFYPDRFAVQRLSLAGMRYNYNAAQEGRAAQFAAAQAERSAEFQQFLTDSAYLPMGNYASGIEFDAYNQYVAYGGNFYRPAPGAIPFTTSGVWEGADEDLFVLFNQDSALRQELAGPSGAGLVGFKSGNVASRLENIVSLSDYPQLTGDHSQTLRDALADAAGRPIVIPAGNWNIKNVFVEDAELVFAPGAVFYAALGADDNVLSLGSNVRILYPNIVVSNSAAPADGAKGLPILAGVYRGERTPISNILIYRPVLTCTNTGYANGSLAISILGDVSEVDIVSPKLFGAFTGGIQAHWGGIMQDDGSTHISTVIESYHPHAIRITDLTLGAFEGNVGYLGVSISAAYDMTVLGYTNNGWVRTAWIQPGDVYAQVAVADQKAKILTGIRMADVDIFNPPVRPANKTAAPISINGISATVRTPTAPTLACDSLSGIVVERVTFVRESDQPYSGAPLIHMYYCADTVVRGIEAVGFEGVAEYLVLDEFSVNCEIEARGATLRGSRSIYSVDAQLTLNSKAGANSFSQTQSFGFSSPGSRSSLSLTSAVAVGATSISCGPTGSFDGRAPRGTRLYVTDTQYFTLSKSYAFSATGANTDIPVTASRVSVSSGTALAIRLAAVGLKLKANLDGWYQAVNVSETAGLRAELKCLNSGKYDVLLTGNSNDDFDIRGFFDGCGRINDGSLLVNVHLGTKGVKGRVSGSFEQSGQALVSSNVYGGTGPSLSATTITDCDFNGATGNYVALALQTPAAAAIGRHNVFANRYGGLVAPLSATTIAGMVIDGRFVGYASGLPTTGTWQRGDRLINSAPSVGNPKGWLCSASGTPGTWVSEGAL